MLSYHIWDLLQALNHHHTTILPSFWPKIQNLKIGNWLQINESKYSSQKQQQTAEFWSASSLFPKPTRPIHPSISISAPTWHFCKLVSKSKKQVQFCSTHKTAIGKATSSLSKPIFEAVHTSPCSFVPT